MLHKNYYLLTKEILSSMPTEIKLTDCDNKLRSNQIKKQSYFNETKLIIKAS